MQRKCWWDGLDIEIPEAGDKQAITVKLWARRVWTLELSLVSGTDTYFIKSTAAY